MQIDKKMMENVVGYDAVISASLNGHKNIKPMFSILECKKTQKIMCMVI